MSTSDTPSLGSLIIFIKNPIPGRAKTRLAATIGLQKAHQVYLELLKRTRMTATHFPGQRHLFYSNQIDPSDDWDPTIFHKQCQATGDLGNRMQTAFNQIIAQDQAPAILIGSDCPALTVDHLTSALRLLQKHDLVLGPAQDGGYYLIGMKQVYAQLFSDINWGTDRVLQQTLAIAEKSQLSSALLETLLDIDTLGDLKSSEFFKTIKL